MPAVHRLVMSAMLLVDSDLHPVCANSVDLNHNSSERQLRINHHSSNHTASSQPNTKTHFVLSPGSLTSAAF